MILGIKSFVKIYVIYMFDKLWLVILSFKNLLKTKFKTSRYFGKNILDYNDG